MDQRRSPTVLTTSNNTVDNEDQHFPKEVDRRIRYRYSSIKRCRSVTNISCYRCSDEKKTLSRPRHKLFQTISFTKIVSKSS